MTETHALHDRTANPAPLGLMAFGMTTLLLNGHNIGLFPLSSMILAMGVCYGGAAQVIAGVMEWKKGNTFGTLAFTSYGFFWLALAAMILMPSKGLGAAASPESMGMFFVAWGVFTAGLFVGTLRMNHIMQAIFGTLTLLFALLALRDFTGSAAIGNAAGWVGLLCGALAMYGSLAQVLNEIYQSTLLPLGETGH